MASKVTELESVFDRVGKLTGELTEIVKKPTIPGYIHGVAPEGWEETVKRMKKHPEIDNPWALAWWMENEGYEPKK